MGYEKLEAVLQAAFDQASVGKGAERHADDKPFHEQPMQQIAARRGLGFILGQADKKSEEAQGMLQRGEVDAFEREILGAIVYLAGAIVFAKARAVPPENWRNWSGLEGEPIGRVEVRFRYGDTCIAESDRFYWNHLGAGGDIVAWRPVQ